MAKQENRGGAREGSGRKPKGPEDKRVRCVAYVLPETAKKLQTLKQQGYSVGMILEAVTKKL